MTINNQHRLTTIIDGKFYSSIINKTIEKTYAEHVFLLMNLTAIFYFVWFVAKLFKCYDNSMLFCMFIFVINQEKNISI